MRSGATRILITHAGDPPRSAAVDAGAPRRAVADATAACVRRQIEVGIDIVGNGEQSREDFLTSVAERPNGRAAERLRRPGESAIAGPGRRWTRTPRGAPSPTPSPRASVARSRPTSISSAMASSRARAFSLPWPNGFGGQTNRPSPGRGGGGRGRPAARRRRRHRRVRPPPDRGRHRCRRQWRAVARGLSHLRGRTAVRLRRPGESAAAPRRGQPSPFPRSVHPGNGEKGRFRSEVHHGGGRTRRGFW